MKLFGFEIRRARQAPASSSTLPVPGSGGWYPVIREPYTGAWQRNEAIDAPTALSYFAVYACISLIATDIGKLKLRLVALDDAGVWQETTNPAYSPVLRKPNRYQTIGKFVEQWITSKLTTGNTYVLKQRDDRGVVSALDVLDPARVSPLVAPDGGVYYALGRNDLAGVVTDRELEGTIVAPAREIIHDRMVTLFHPLIGVTPLFACGFAALQGLTIQSQSERFFRTGRPSGFLTAPGSIHPETAKRLQDNWETNYGGENTGRVAVAGDGLEFKTLTINAADAQLIEQLKWTANTICSCYHVPPAMLDLDANADAPAKLEPLLQKYHSQCIQSLLTAFETTLDEGLELKTPYGTEFDIDDLIWLDTDAKTKAATDSIRAGALSPNEARKKYFGLGPVVGGDTPYMQQQMYSLRALAERDADQPFSKATPGPVAAAPGDTGDDDDDADALELEASAFRELLTKALEAHT